MLNIFRNFLMEQINKKITQELNHPKNFSIFSPSPVLAQPSTTQHPKIKEEKSVFDYLIFYESNASLFSLNIYKIISSLKNKFITQISLS